MHPFFKISFFCFTLTFIPQLNAEEIKRQVSWQQRSDHEIQVELVPAFSQNIPSVLIAKQQIKYFNNSPDTLNEIRFHLWPNAYRNNQTPFARQLAEFSEKEFLLSDNKGFCTVSNVLVNNNQVIFHDSHTEIATINLTSPLLPGDSLLISMDFSVQMPELFSRLGTKGSFHAATQWYPKPAVYDVNGWNTMPYLNQGEFYSEFGNYKVTITAPANYLIAATGEMQNETEMEWMKKITKEIMQYSSTKLTDYLNENNIDSNTKSLTFIQDNVHDFAWFASPHFYYFTKTVKLNTGKVVTIELFSDNSEQSGLDVMAESLIKYSEAVGEYPYNVCKVAVGSLIAGGGMEYPTITVCVNQSRELILHELGHNWFYGILATNERRWPWMDESVNSFYEKKFTAVKPVPFDIKKLWKEKKFKNVFNYGEYHSDKFLTLSAQRNNTDQEADLPASDYSSMNYYTVLYAKAPRYFEYLESYIGATLFEQCMKAYYEKWKFRHPLPDDMMDVFNQISGMDLSWFFHELLSNKKGIDFGFRSAIQDNDSSFTLTLENINGQLIPVQYAVYVNYELYETEFITPFNKDTTINIRNIGEDSDKLMLLIDPFHLLPEMNRKNNLIFPDKKHKKNPPLNITMLPVVDHPYNNELGIYPALMRNIYSGYGIGVAVTNHFFPSKKFEYYINPFFALKSGNINAVSDISYHFIGEGPFIYKTTTGVHFKRFDYLPNQSKNVYNRINPYLEFNLLNKGRIPIRIHRKIRFDFTRIISDKTSYEIYNPNLDTTFNLNFSPHTNSSLMKASYIHRDMHATRPLNYALTLEGGESYDNTNNNKLFAKAEFRFRISLLYKRKKSDRKSVKKFRGEFNTGQFLFHDPQMSGIYLYRGSGNNGVYDYDFSDYHFGRNSAVGSRGLTSRQMITRAGDMRINAPSFAGLGYTSIKTETTLPGIIPFRLYADFSIEHIQNPVIFGAGGISFVVMEDVFELYIPLVYTSGFTNYYSLNKQGFFDRICFKFNLNQLIEAVSPENMMKKVF